MIQLSIKEGGSCIGCSGLGSLSPSANIGRWVILRFTALGREEELRVGDYAIWPAHQDTESRKESYERILAYLRNRPGQSLDLEESAVKVTRVGDWSAPVEENVEKDKWLLVLWHPAIVKKGQDKLVFFPRRKSKDGEIWTTDLEYALRYRTESEAAREYRKVYLKSKVARVRQSRYEVVPEAHLGTLIAEVRRTGGDCGRDPGTALFL